MSVAELARNLGVSSSTIRRDLQTLQDAGRITRTFGGALPVEEARASLTDSGDPETSWGASGDDEAKSKIGAQAAELVEDGATVILDIGTTTPYIARQLRGRPVTIVTNNIAVFDEVRSDEVSDVVLLGGLYRRNYRTLVGSLAGSGLAEIRADLTFLSCTGVSPSGRVVDDIALEASTKKDMIGASERTVLVAAAKKFPGRGSQLLCDLQDVAAVVTSAAPTVPSLLTYAENGGKVLYV